MPLSPSACASATPLPAASTSPTARPRVTVAAIVLRGSSLLLVEEHTRDGLRLNNPAGHLETGESPLQAVVREVREETGRLFTPQGFLGIYLARHTGAGGRISSVRLAFTGTVSEPEPGAVLDTGIVRDLWLNIDSIESERHRLRTPLVQACLRDALAGRVFPLDLIRCDASIYELAPG